MDEHGTAAFQGELSEDPPQIAIHATQDAIRSREDPLGVAPHHPRGEADSVRQMNELLQPPPATPIHRS